jgi:DNA-binding CsgD family transcriptional regulator
VDPAAAGADPMDPATAGGGDADPAAAAAVAVLVDPGPEDWQEAQCLGARIVLVCSGELDEPGVVAAFLRGADALVPLSRVPQELSTVVELVALGSTLIDPAHARLLVEMARIQLASPTGPELQLTAREREILASIARGESVTQTADALGIAAKTVANLQGRLFRSSAPATGRRRSPPPTRAACSPRPASWSCSGGAGSGRAEVVGSAQHRQPVVHGAELRATLIGLTLRGVGRVIGAPVGDEVDRGGPTSPAWWHTADGSPGDPRGGADRHVPDHFRASGGRLRRRPRQARQGKGELA